MSYSQKYTLVQFLEPVQDHQAFSMDAWPLHITLADVFAVELNQSLLNQLTNHLASQKTVLVEAMEDDSLGEVGETVGVTLIKNTVELQHLHDNLTKFLSNNGAIFNSPQFTYQGFLPHASHQKHSQLKLGQKVTINELSLVDMFVGGDWKKRQIIKSFKLSN